MYSYPISLLQDHQDYFRRCFGRHLFWHPRNISLYLPGLLVMYLPEAGHIQAMQLLHLLYYLIRHILPVRSEALRFLHLLFDVLDVLFRLRPVEISTILLNHLNLRLILRPPGQREIRQRNAFPLDVLRRILDEHLSSSIHDARRLHGHVSQLFEYIHGSMPFAALSTPECNIAIQRDSDLLVAYMLGNVSTNSSSSRYSRRSPIIMPLNVVP
mmetsp:Transcript_37128/g.104759  ORF Transcript_37128/g.104759 Transcript_37128/m.104759 type:complete len:213 (-) Transcript_37128:268-906(-)